MRPRICAYAALLVTSACAGHFTADGPTPTPSLVAPEATMAVQIASALDDKAKPVSVEMHTVGERLYQERCSTCHDAGRAPPRSQIATLSRQEIIEALDTGFMAAIAQFMTPEEKTSLVWHLSREQVP